MNRDQTPTEAEHVAALQAEARAAYVHAQNPATQAAARDQRALAVAHAQDSAAANTRR
ncbi:hypothetical protein [Streptomyces sp. DH12]|uniref:hypothetical protein n=1 Tax=Streptomyces sp. DH12 TaxID=2857010 RepID=UPI001E5A6B24|nr:hypothetical protein [Streptomyces sp. DH12]